MPIIGIDISKAKFDAALLVGERVRHAAFSNTEAGFAQVLAWLAKQGSDPDAPRRGLGSKRTENRCKCPSTIILSPRNRL